MSNPQKMPKHHPTWWVDVLFQMVDPRYLQHFHLDHYLSEALRTCGTCDSPAQLAQFFQAQKRSWLSQGWLADPSTSEDTLYIYIYICVCVYVYTCYNMTLYVYIYRCVCVSVGWFISLICCDLLLYIAYISQLLIKQTSPAAGGFGWQPLEGESSAVQDRWWTVTAGR